MRPILLLALTACTTTDILQDEWARTADSGLVLQPTADDNCPSDPNKTEPGYCGCEWVDVDTNTDLSADACVHMDASVDPLAVLAAGVEVGAYAQVGAATLQSNAVIGTRAFVGDGATIGAGSLLSRRARVEPGAHLGPDSVMGRSSTLGANVDASVGSLALGYGSALGANSVITGTPVTIGNLVTIGTNATLAAGTVIARGSILGDRVTLGTTTILGPETELGDDVTLGTGVRIRKDTSIGSNSQVGNNVRIGRGGEMAAGTQIGNNAVVRANVTVLTNGAIAEDEYVPRNTTIEPRDNCDAQDSFDKVWDGSFNNDWNNADNWTPAGVPDNTDSVFICGLTAIQPRLSADAAARTLSMSLTSTLDTWVRTISVHGDLEATDIFGAGTVAVMAPATIRGAVPRLDIRSDVALGDDVAVRNNLIIQSGSSLTVGAATLDVTNGFEQTLAQPDDGLRLTDPAATVTIGSHAQFHGSTNMAVSNLDQGTLKFRAAITADNNGYALLKVGALTVFDGPTPHGLTLPNSSASGSYFTDVVLDGIANVQPQQGYPLYIAGDLTVRNNGASNFSTSDVTVAGDLTLEDTSRIYDQVSTVRVEGTIDVAAGATLDVHRLAIVSQFPDVAGTLAVNQMLVVGDVVLTAPYTATSAVRIEPTGTLTPAGHLLTFNSNFQQDIGTNPTAGLHMVAGDTVRLVQGGSFMADVDMAATNFTGGTLITQSHLSNESVPVRTIYMPGTVLETQPVSSSLVVYMGHGHARFGTIRVPAGASVATNTSNGAASTVDNLEIYGGLTPNADLTVTGTLTVGAGGSISSASGAITTVQGACNIDSDGYAHTNVHCP